MVERKVDRARCVGITTRNLISPQLSFPRNTLMADVKKQEKDYTKEVDQLIPEAESIARVSIGGSPGFGVAFRPKIWFACSTIVHAGGKASRERR